jgi:hypothetical protein
MKRLLLVVLSVFADNHNRGDQPIISTIDLEIAEGRSEAFIPDPY